MKIPVSLTVNGKPVTTEVEPRTLLVELLREHLQLTGTHVGCDTAQCGACTVLVDGKPVKCCNMLAIRPRAPTITTIEGLATKASCTRCRPRSSKYHGLQCGFCTPGMVMARRRTRGAEQASQRGADPRGARRQLLPLHRLPQHREGGAGRPRGNDGLRRHHERHHRSRKGARGDEARGETVRPHRRAHRAQGRRALPHRRRPVHRRRQPAQPELRGVRALAARARAHQVDQDRCGEAPRPACSASTPAPTCRPPWAGCPAAGSSPASDGKPMKEPKHPILAQGKVRYVGDAVAIVVAETLDAGPGSRGAGGRGLRAAARGGGRARRARQGSARGARRGAGQRLLRLGAGRQGGAWTPPSRRPRT